ncbi:MAG: NAD(P)-binding domain-containing protein [Methylococcaceae bacterium]|nr:NAD(P)-binding domain-containing protein [Methylococcaceae bacterium]
MNSTAQSTRKNAVVIGAGCGGLIAAKELLEKGFRVKILEQDKFIGGIWGRIAWKTFTLTSSKWITEFGCFPMPNEYPDFLTNQHMLAYLQAFAEKFNLIPLIEFDRTVSEVVRSDEGKFGLVTNHGNYDDIDYLVVASGLHARPSIPEYPGITQFAGKVMHSSEYHNSADFKGKKVLCIGLGESGVGLVGELAQVTKKLVVSSQGVALAPRVVKNTQNPFDQMQFWQFGRHMIGYQEVLTSGLGWIHRKIPFWLKKRAINSHLRFYSDHTITYEQFKEWFPKAVAPHHFHVKFWSKPSSPEHSGNLTRPDLPPDDLLYLIKSGKILPKGGVESFDPSGARFSDQSFEEFDTVIFNTGFQPSAMHIRFPGEWKYNHRDLFKGCIHPRMPNLAFVGMVRPTIGSIPAMAEMHSRLVAALFSGSIPLPDEPERLRIVENDDRSHRDYCSKMHARFPHIYFFDGWMEETAALIGAAPKLSKWLGGFERIRAYFFGAAMPLRYRIDGDGKSPEALELYLKRVDKVWGNAFGKWAMVTIVTHWALPYILSALTGVIAYAGLGLSALLSILSAAGFYLLYRFVDLFRFVFEISIANAVSLAFGLLFNRQLRREVPNYADPEVFQSV